MSKNKRQRKFAKWHRRLGMASAVVVFLLSLTGILLNHTSELGLGAAPVQSDMLLSLYGQQLPEITSHHVAVSNSSYYASVSGQQFFINGEPAFRCDSPFVGLAVLPSDLMLGCERELVLFNHRHQILDEITSVFGLPIPLAAVSTCGNSYCILSDGNWLQLDRKNLTWVEFSGDAGEHLIEQPNQLLRRNPDLPDTFKKSIQSHFSGDGISWERVIVDLHAGRFLGSIGPWIMDAFAMMFMILAITGCYMWFRRRGKKKKRRYT